MPIYEYRCSDCRRKMSQYVRSFSEASGVVCTNCGSDKLVRLFSTFAVVKTDQDVYDDILSDSNLMKGMMANDPRAMLEWSRRMEGTESEKNPEYEEMMQRMERGESMDQIMAGMQQDDLASPEAELSSGIEE